MTALLVCLIAFVITFVVTFLIVKEIRYQRELTRQFARHQSFRRTRIFQEDDK